MMTIMLCVGIILNIDRESARTVSSWR
jgi:hypothetical protein